jgi:hypothetical protein
MSINAQEEVRFARDSPLEEAGFELSVPPERDYEVRSAEEAFSELPDGKADDEMLDLALHIIKKKPAVRPDHVR